MTSQRCIEGASHLILAFLSMRWITDWQKIHHGILHGIIILPPEKLINLSLSIGLVRLLTYNPCHPYMPSTKQTILPPAQNSSSQSRILLYTFAAALLAIIALFIPPLLRGRSFRQITTASLGSRYHSTPTSTMSEVKLTPREVKEWNV